MGQISRVGVGYAALTADSSRSLFVLELVTKTGFGKSDFGSKGTLNSKERLHAFP